MIRKLTPGLLLLCLLLCGACSGKEHAVTVPVVVRLSPPDSLLRETVEPEWKGETNGDLAEHAISLRASLRECNADKAAIRFWLADTPQNANGATDMGKDR